LSFFKNNPKNVHFILGIVVFYFRIQGKDGYKAVFGNFLDLEAILDKIDKICEKNYQNFLIFI